MPRPAETSATTLAIEAPPTIIAEIAEEARKYGLQPSSYLLMLHCMHTGSVGPAFLGAVKEIFVQDREILGALAK